MDCVIVEVMESTDAGVTFKSNSGEYVNIECAKFNMPHKVKALYPVGLTVAFPPQYWEQLKRNGTVLRVS
jgi:hypothetical protein